MRPLTTLAATGLALYALYLYRLHGGFRANGAASAAPVTADPAAAINAAVGPETIAPASYGAPGRYTDPLTLIHATTGGINAQL